MSFVLTIYGTDVYQEFQLPAVNNTDYEIILSWKNFALPKDVILRMEVMDNKWKFCEGSDYKIRKDEKNYVERDLQNNDILSLRLNDSSAHYVIVVAEKENIFPCLRKYLLPASGSITIGSGKHNHIVYNKLNRVSKDHAHIDIIQNRCVLFDVSKNGVYINHSRVLRTHVLEFGDTINIIGLKMVFMGSFLAIDTSVPELTISESALTMLAGGEIADACIVGAPEPAEEKPKKYFNRKPRTLETIDEEPFEIEGPPTKDNSKRQPVFLTLGPSLTMAIPMSLGCVMSIMGSGSNSSVFMYTGLVTAFGSAIIGSIWGAVRLKYEKKNRAENEALRLSAYGEYLDEKEKEISERYEEDKRILCERYPAAGILCAQDEDYISLWNRNNTHSDFMYYRIGTGESDFPSQIVIPAKRFSLFKDDLANRPSEIKDKYKKLKGVPIGIDLLEHPLIGFVGGDKKAGAYEVLKNLIVQIAAANCYTDVKLAIVYDGKRNEERENFEMLRWLPHTWSMDKKSRYVADNQNDAADIYYELVQILRERAENANSMRENAIYKPVYVLIVSDVEMIKGELISKYLLDAPEKLGFVTILLAERYEELPNNCEYIVDNSGEKGSFTGVYSVRGEEEERYSVHFDSVTNESVDRFCRKLSDIEVEEMETGGELANTLTFFEMMNISRLDDLDVMSRWIKNRTYESMRGLIGQQAGGAPCYLDVHEKYHGPHGLVAGTTGSGKSETLQTYILSMAINYSPDDVGFFIIDYKGGGMANLFSDLPHLMGQISNLSGNQVRRAMVSIKSENRRRQRVFNEYGVNNINSYTRLIKNGEASLPVPHLFIIIDEFAELKREEPEFMRELISVAQVGRSLGVHLILATQKPSGTVDDNIWSNSKFRLCLRVQDKQDSNDMLHKPDAAYITQAGRGYLQVGNDELYELFQSGWSGAAYDDFESDGKIEIVKMYALNGKAAIVGNRLKMHRQETEKMKWYRQFVTAADEILTDEQAANEVVNNPRALREAAARLSEILRRKGIDFPTGDANEIRLENILVLCAESLGSSADKKVQYIMQEAPKRSMRLPEPVQKTQLDAIVDYLGNIARENGYNHKFLLWLPVLPENLYLDELPEFKETGFNGKEWILPKRWDMKAVVGLCDDPANQAQTTLELDFAENGHHVICGLVGSGKSTFLQTLVFSLAHRYSPDYVNFYIMDFSSNSMRAYEKLAHVGAVMYENDLEEISRFFHMIEDIFAERRKMLNGGNYKQYVQTHGVKLPSIFVMIDQYSNFREKTGNIYEEQLIRLSRDGAACGIYLVITAAGFGMTEISNNIGKNIKTVVCLEMGDKFQYADKLHTTQIQVLPETGVRGRGLVRSGDRVLEYQTALAQHANDDYSRIDKIMRACEKMNQAWTGRKAKQVPRIPEKPVMDDLLSLEETEELLKNDYAIPIGYNYDNAVPYYVDLRTTFSYLISGKNKTGRTNLLKLMIMMTAKKNIRIYVVDFTNKLRGIAEQCQAQYIDSDQAMYDMFLGWKDTIIERNELRKKLEDMDTPEEEIYRQMAAKGQICLFVDNLADFLQHMYYPAKEVPIMTPFVENITEKGAGLGMYYISVVNAEELTAFSGLKVCSNLLRKKEGIQLGGNPAAQRLMNFDYLSFKEQSQVLKPGIGLLPEIDGEVPVRKVVLPLV